MDNLTTFAFIALAYLLYYHFPTHVRWWAWTKVVPIAAIQPSRMVRIRGTIEALDEVLDGPLSRLPCVHYASAVAEDTHEKGKWREIHRVQRSVDFAVRDETGVVIVRLECAIIEAQTTCTTRSGDLGAPSAREAAFLERFGEAPTDLDGCARLLRFTEAALKVGDIVTVRGQARHASGQIPTLIVAPARRWLRIADDRPGVSTSKSFEV